MAETPDGSSGSPDDKRKRIIEAALREFAERGFDAASTNSITETAGISKGLLFHYFGSKQGLYLAIVQHCIEHSAAWSAQDREDEPPAADFFERLLQTGMRKLRYTVEHPLETKFVLDAFVSPPDGLKADIEALGEAVRPAVTGYWTESIDTSKFRAGISVAKAVEVVMTFMEGLRVRYAKPGMLDRDKFEAVFRETREYFEILKYGIYEGRETPAEE